MKPDIPLWILVLATVATYPSIGLSWCVAALIGGGPWPQGLKTVGSPMLAASVVLMLVSVVSCLMALSSLAKGVVHTRRLWVRLMGRRTIVPRWLATELRMLGIGDVVLVRGDEQLAVTVGWWRPRIVITTGLVAALSRAELRVVLVHERSHQRHRDPLRLVVTRMLAAHLWFVPVAADLRTRANQCYELKADATAIALYGRSTVAGVLLRMVDAVPSRQPASAAAHFFAPAVLAVRVRQLENGTQDMAWTSAPRVTASAVTAVGFAVSVVSVWTLMLLVCPCGM